jgi:hypothetical protein
VACYLNVRQHDFQRPNSRKFLFYFLVSVFAPPGFGLASALGAVPAVAKAFFLSALGFLG